MGDKKQNIKNLFNNSKTRIIILLTLVVLLTAVAIGIFRMNKGVNVADSTIIQRNAGAIRSIPGSPDPTSQYAKLQKFQNKSNAKDALIDGGSTIPTLVSSQTFGNGIEQVGDRKSVV